MIETAPRGGLGALFSSRSMDSHYRSKGGAEADGSMPNAASIAKSKNVKQFDPRKTTFMVVEPERVGVPSTSAILKQFHDTVYECSDKS